MPNQDYVIGILNGVLAQWFWPFVIAVFGIMAKETIFDMIRGFALFVGKTYEERGYYMYKGIRKCKIVKIGAVNTILYFFDTETELTIENSKLKTLLLEKRVPGNPFKGVEKEEDEG